MDFKKIAFWLMMCLLVPSAFADGLRDAFDHYKRNPAGSFSNDDMRGWVGPSFHARNNIVEPRLVTARMPSWNAGCGGIDFFAGSFSVVTRDELVQMARGIAAGAPGYFFNLAMTSVCPSCAEQMAELQQKLEKFNQLTMDSCNRAWDAVEEKTGWIQSQKGNSTIVGTTLDAATGVVDDWGQVLLTDKSTKEKPSKNEAEAANTNTIAEHAQQKIEANPAAEFLTDLRTEELYMSIFGTSIMQSEVQPDGSYEILIKPVAATFDFKKALYNKATDVMPVTKCAQSIVDDPKCTDVVPADIPFEGLTVRSSRLISGKSSTPEDMGILPKMMANVPLTPEQEQFKNNTRYSYTQILKQYKDNQNLIPTAGELLSLQVAKESMTEFYGTLKNELIKVTTESAGGLTPAKRKLIDESIEKADIRFKDAIDSIDRQILTLNNTITLQAALKQLVTN